ncbi:MAG: hypothetical protein COZ05_18485 [Armatimonadetes bacterium CG_4_10_14_3_um_filter_59_10]|nr:MAG: hypothetical protein COZ05_18485 [Armatimonadetes bacterium CG_4_10_14_3_um_filter_59_10]
MAVLNLNEYSFMRVVQCVGGTFCCNGLANAGGPLARLGCADEATVGNFQAGVALTWMVTDGTTALCPMTVNQ